MVPAPKQHPLAIALSIATVARVVPLLIFREPTGLFYVDIDHYHAVAEAVLHGQDAYAAGGSTIIHPYLPFQMYVFALADGAANAFNVSFFALVRIPTILADLTIVALLYRVTSELRGDDREAFRNALAYAVCPFPVMVAVYHGQFDSISVMFALASWFTIVSRPLSGRSVLIGAALLGVGILEKTWPVFLLPVLLVQIDAIRSRLIFLATAIGVPVVACILYVVAFSASLSFLIRRITKYRAPPNLDGHTLILDHLSRRMTMLKPALEWDNHYGTLIVFAAVLIALAVYLPRRQPLAATIAVIVAFLTATTNGGSYHYLWVVPFAILARQRVFASLLIAAAVARYLIIAFVGGGMFFGAVIYPRLQPMSDYAWMIGVIEWGVLLSWFTWNVATSRRPSGNVGSST